MKLVGSPVTVELGYAWDVAVHGPHPTTTIHIRTCEHELRQLSCASLTYRHRRTGQLDPLAAYTSPETVTTPRQYRRRCRNRSDRTSLVCLRDLVSTRGWTNNEANALQMPSQTYALYKCAVYMPCKWNGEPDVAASSRYINMWISSR